MESAIRSEYHWVESSAREAVHIFGTFSQGKMGA